MQIIDHMLTGDRVTKVHSPNQSGSIIPEYLIMHYTAGRSAQSSVEHLTSAASRASAHLVIARDGHIWQLVPFNRKAWHAGISNWAELRGMNSYSIGIELDNAGMLTKVGNRYQAWFGHFYEEREVLQAPHKHDDPHASWNHWHVYTEDQVSAALAVSRLLVRQYSLKTVLGHDDVSPGRKRDPGPAFRMDSFHANLFGRGEDVPMRFEVNAHWLNIRSGPGFGYAKVASPLKRETEVELVEMAELWAHVALLDGSCVEGWVRNTFVSPVA